MNKVNEQIWNLLVLLKEPKRTRQPAITNTNQSHLSLPNGKDGLIWFGAANGCPLRRLNGSETSSQQSKGGEASHCWLGCSFFGGGYGRCSAMGSAKGREQQHQSTPMSEWAPMEKEVKSTKPTWMAVHSFLRMDGMNWFWLIERGSKR